MGQEINPWICNEGSYQCGEGATWDHKISCEIPLAGILCC